MHKLLLWIIMAGGAFVPHEDMIRIYQQAERERQIAREVKKLRRQMRSM